MNIEEVIADLEKQVTDNVRRLALDVTANLIEDTPVDTGWARANWIPSLEQPVTNVAGARPTDTQGSVNLALQNQGIASIATASNLVGSPIYISNNVNYIRFLNEGHSKQAPRAFVQAAIERAIESNR